MNAHRLVLIAALGAAVWAPRPAAADLPAQLYVVAPQQSAFWRIDTATGDREILELSDYPVVMKITRGLVTPGGELVFSAANAAQSHAILAYNPFTRTRSAVSGPVDGYGEVVRGSGPPFEPAVSGLALAPWGALYVLRAYQGPVHVSLATGDRNVVSQSSEPRVGYGFPMTRPVDVAVESAATLLVMDEHEGIVRVRLADGARTMAYPSTLFIEPPYRFDLLPDGRIVHLEPGLEAVFVFDPKSAIDAPLSGRGRGRGPSFGALSDVAVAPDGTVLVTDTADPALFAVDPATGDRTLLSGPARGRGVGLPTAVDRPMIVGFAAESVPANAPDRRARRHLQRTGS